MKADKYTTEANNTDLQTYINPSLRAHNESRGIHYAMGLCTEASEVLDIFKKNMMYGKVIDLINLREELGDILWYMSGFCRMHGWTFEEIMEVNIRKLKARFPDKFTEDAALNRDLAKEAEALKD